MQGWVGIHDMKNDEFIINWKKKSKNRVNSFCDNDSQIVKEAMKMTSINFVLAQIFT